MIAYQLGDVDAFAELVARHEKPVWNFLRRLVPDPATAEDLLQQIFMRVVDHGPAWQPNARFCTWLYAIAHRVCVEHARTRVHPPAGRVEPSSGGAGSEGSHAPDAPQRADAQHALDSELGRQVERAVAELPAPERETFVMREVLELTFAEIATIVGADELTIKSRMRAALEQLRESLSVPLDVAECAETGP